MKPGQIRVLNPALDSIWNDNFNVVMVYEDTEAGERAMEMLSKLVHEFGDQLRFHPHLWRFDVLSHPGCRHLAETETIRANLLIISTSSEQDLPLEVRAWFIASLASRQTKGGVVALFGPEGHVEAENSLRLKFLRDATHVAALDLFRPHIEFPLCHGRGDFSKYPSPPSHGKETLLHPELSNRGWGINE